MKMLKMLSCLTALLCLTACGGTTTSQGESQAPESKDESKAAVEVTEAESEEETQPLTNAPMPTADANAVTFDDGDCSFATIICDDTESCNGTLSVETVDGNAMLKYTYDPAVLTEENYDVMVQKVSINVMQLLTPEQIDQVYSIGFDMFAEANADVFVNDNGDNVMVPGWIGGGGGTMTADDKWTSFSDFSGSGLNEYDLQRSDACHVEFKFMLASAGKKWTAEMEDVNFLIMRWGMQNLSNTYIDNITFYDEAGNSIPLTRSAAQGGAEDAPEDSAAEETAATSEAE